MDTGYWKMNPFQKKPESEKHPDNPHETDMTKFIRIFHLNSNIQLENNVLSLVKLDIV